MIRIQKSLFSDDIVLLTSTRWTSLIKMLIYFILLITLIWCVCNGTTLDVRRPTGDSMSARNVVISIFGLNAYTPDLPTMLRIPSKNNFNEIVLADLNYNDKLATKPSVQIYPLTKKFIRRPSITTKNNDRRTRPYLFNIPSTDLCCIEHEKDVLNNNRLFKNSVPYKDAFVTTKKLAPLITKSKGIFEHKDNSTVDGIETKKDNQSIIHKINREQSILVSNVSVKIEKMIPAYNSENSKNKLGDHASQLKRVGSKDLKDIKMYENVTTPVPETTYDQYEEVISTTEVFVDITEKIQKHVQSLNDTLKSSEPVHSNNIINIYNTSEQVKIKKEFMPDVLKKNIAWLELFSSLAKINTSSPLKHFQNVTNNYLTLSDFKLKNQSSQKQKDLTENVVKQRITMNSNNNSNESVAYIKNKLFLSNFATFDKPILFPPEKPEFYSNNDDSEALVRKPMKPSLKEGNRGDIPNF